MVLLRRVIGDALRARRQAQHRTLREVSTAANVSLGYLSEIERGQKEASSELLAAICGALGARLSELLSEVSRTVATAERRAGDVLSGARDLRGADVLRDAGADGVSLDDLVLEDAALDDLVSVGARSGEARSAGATTDQAEAPAAENSSSDRATVPAGPTAHASTRPSPTRATSSRRPSDRAAGRPLGAGATGAGLRAPAGARPSAGQLAPVDAAPGAPRAAVKAGVARARLSALVEGDVSVTVRQDGPLKATLQARRNLSGQDRDLLVTV